jgi:D-alanine-D-alanine ligase
MYFMSENGESLRMSLAYAVPADGSAPSRIATRIETMAGILAEAGASALVCPARSGKELESLLRSQKPHLVFSASHRIPDKGGRSRKVHELLESLGYPYVGSSGKVLEIALSKNGTKRLWRSKGIPSPESFMIWEKRDGSIVGMDRLSRAANYPYIVKPAKEGNSRGITESSVAGSLEELTASVREAIAFHKELIIERFLGLEEDFREFTVALVGNGMRRRLLPSEIKVGGEGKFRLVTTESKDSGEAAAVPVAEERLRIELSRLAGKAFDALGVRDYSRCDILLSGGKLYAIEVNGQPMVPDPWFEACARQAEMGEGRYILAIAAAAVARNAAEGREFPFIPPQFDAALGGHLPEGVFEPTE